MTTSGPVLVTGAAGFIGSHLTEALVEQGMNVRVFAHYNSRGDLAALKDLPSEVMQSVELVWGDLKDADAVRRAAKGAESIFHLGALIGIPYSYRNPRDVVETNVIGTLNALEAARDTEASRLVVVSSSEVYGTAVEVPMSESHPLQGQSPYSASKIGAEKLAESFYLSYGLPVTVVRPFNTYGPRQSDRAVIPTIISQALAGGEIRLGSVIPRRDFSFVTDTAEGLIAASRSDSAVGETINLGTGIDVSVSDVVLKVSELLGRELVVSAEDDRVRPPGSEVGRLQADFSKARQLCGWEPKVSLDEGLRRTIAWIRSNMNRFNPGVYGV